MESDPQIHRPARPSWLAALPALFTLFPGPDFLRKLPRLTPQERMNRAWEKTGQQMQTALTAYARRHDLRTIASPR